MGTALVIALVVIALLIAVSLVLGRASHEVESARDTEYVELEGRWIRYAVNGGGPPVLLVHDWLSSSRIWDGLAERLARQFTVYTLDLTGFGESDKPLSGYGVRNGSRLLYAFCAHFGITQAGVVGHGLGGDMAVKLAADRPDVVGRLALVSTPSSSDQIDLPTFLWLATIPGVGPIFYALGRFTRPLRALWMRPFVVNREDLIDQVVEDARRSTPAAVKKTLSAARREIVGTRLTRQAGGIRVPVLVVAGEEDRIVDPLAVEVWGSVMRQAEIHLLEDCGHLPMIERPEEFEPHILAFLTGHEAPPDHDYDATESSAEQMLAPETEDEPAFTPEEEREDEVEVPEVKEPSVESSPGEPESELPPEEEDEPAEQPSEPEPAREEGAAQERIPRFPEDLFEWPEPGPPRSRKRPDSDDEKNEEPPRP